MAISFDMKGVGGRFERVFTLAGGSMRLTLVTPSSGWRMQLAQSAGVGGDPHYDKFLEVIARDYWVDFDGAVDQDGEPIPNNPENRYALLQASWSLANFVLLALNTEQERVAEGKGASVSA